MFSKQILADCQFHFILHLQKPFGLVDLKEILVRVKDMNIVANAQVNDYSFTQLLSLFSFTTIFEN